MSESQRPPDAPGPGQAGYSREITYRVGWKSGTIRMKDHAEPQTAPADVPPPPSRQRKEDGASRPAGSLQPAVPAGAFSRWMLHGAPMLPAAAWRYVLFALPLLTFAVFCWLAYELSSFD